MKLLSTRITATWVMAIVWSILFQNSQTAHAQPGETQTIYEQNSALVQDFKPQPLWEYFVDLCSIPRCSEDELAVSQLVVDVATENNLKVVRDSLYNVIVYVPAYPGFENRPPICIQGHLDMVCQAKDGDNNIFPLELVLKDDTLRTDGTTLGADNGIGVSAMLLLMSDTSLQHGALELLFTTLEEIGLIGAEGFDCSLLQSKLMYNVDSEEDSIITIGSAGGAVMQTTFVPKFIGTKKSDAQYTIKVSGFKGGHSGTEINLNRGNAITVLTQVLSALEGFDISLISISGGTAINTIPRECQATISFSGDNSVEFEKTLMRIGGKLPSMFREERPSFTFSKLQGTDKALKAMKVPDKEALLTMLGELPNGVISMEEANPKLVRTSNNIGVIEMHGDTVVLKMLFRSSSNPEIDSMINVIKSMCGYERTEMVLRIPPWEPNFDAPLVKLATSTYEDVFHKELGVQTIHAGLESSVFYEKMPDVQIISFGPNVGRAHTPDEYVSVQSVERFWNYLLALIRAE